VDYEVGDQVIAIRVPATMADAVTRAAARMTLTKATYARLALLKALRDDGVKVGEPALQQ
jgi:hypothetical protein